MTQRAGEGSGLSFTFVASVAKVQTMIDNGLRVTLDMDEGEIEAAAKLMTYKREGVAVKVRVEPE